MNSLSLKAAVLICLIVMPSAMAELGTTTSSTPDVPTVSFETKQPEDQSSESTSQLAYNVRFGAFAGGVIANASLTLNTGISPYTSSSRTGFAGGVFAEIQMNEVLFFRPEVMYIQKGGMLSSGYDQRLLRYDAIEIPLLLEGKFGSEALKAVVFGGPSISFGINSTVQINGYSYPTTGASTFDLGIHAGLGGEFNVTSSTSVFANGRYIQGFLNMNQAGNYTTRLSGFLFVGGVSFGL